MSLSRRELEVAALVGQGYTDKQIAGILGLSLPQTRRTVYAIAEKLRLDRTRNIRVQIAKHMAA